MIYKPAYDAETALAWHQDYTFWDHVGPADMGTCWIALDDATVDNGCMHVIPGSHRWPMRYDREDAVVDDPHWLLQQEGIPAGADLTPVPCEVKAGHCHFHHCRTFHGSYGNKTDNPRRSYIMHLMPGHTRRLGDNWNERMGNVETVGVGEVLPRAGLPRVGSRVKVPLNLSVRWDSLSPFLCGMIPGEIRLVGSVPLSLRSPTVRRMSLPTCEGTWDRHTQHTL